MGGRGMFVRFWHEIQKERSHYLEEVDVGGRIILRWVTDK
jgi:hypothetical protein